MNRIFGKIENNPLFEKININDFEKMFNCMEAHTQSYNKGETILMTGSEVKYMGIILSGGVRIVKEDIDGNTVILTELGESELFGEVFACAGIKYSPVTVSAVEHCEILFLNYKRIITLCSSACSFHNVLIENMLRLIAEKNIMLNKKLDILSKRTIREKILALLNDRRGSTPKVILPFNREEMARYLCVDRSALSNELCKLRDEGIISFNKNVFEFIN